MKFTEDFKNEGLRVRLTMQEKADLRARLSERMKLNPASPALQSPYHFFIFNHIVLQRTFAVLVLLVFVVGSGGGTSYAAQAALPGDLLYAVKIYVNESVQTSLARSPLAKAQVHADLAERRIEEAQMLASRGTLTDVAAVELQVRFDEHAAAAQTLTEALAVTDPSAAAQLGTELSSSLAANDAVLVSLGEQSTNEETKRTTRVLSERVRTRSGAIARANVQVLENAHVVVAGPEAQEGGLARSKTATMSMTMALPTSTANGTEQDDATSTAPSPAPNLWGEEVRQSIADGLKAKATKELETLLKQLSVQEVEQDTERVAEELAATRVLMSAGNTALGAADYDTAISKFTRALQKVVELSAFVRAEHNFKSDIAPLLDFGVDGH